MTYTLTLDPTTNSSIAINLYQNVKNIKDLQTELAKGSLNCCIVKPSLIVHPFQIVVAANKAVLAEKLTTKNVYTEILFNLSISKNITQTLQKFGIDNKENNILVVVIFKDDCPNHPDEIFKKIDGQLADISFLCELTNISEVKKSYKLSDVELNKLSLLDSVVSRIATKDVL